MSFFGFIREDPTFTPEDVSLPELQWLSRIERAGRLVDHMTWCERRLWLRGLTTIFICRKYPRSTEQWKESEITALGREILARKRAEWHARHKSIENP